MSKCTDFFMVSNRMNTNIRLLFQEGPTVLHVYTRMSFGSISVLSPVGRLVKVQYEMCEILQKTENMDGVT